MTKLSQHLSAVMACRLRPAEAQLVRVAADVSRTSVSDFVREAALAAAAAVARQMPVEDIYERADADAVVLRSAVSTIGDDR